MLGLGAVVFMGLFSFQMLALWVVSLFLEQGVSSFIATPERNEDMGTALRRAWLFVEGMSSGGGFLLAPYLYLRYVAPVGTWGRMFSKKPRGLSWGLCFLLIVLFMGVNVQIIEWNKSWQFPEAFSALEAWAQDKEAAAARITEQITRMPTVWDFLLTLAVVGLVAALGEELLFRGLLQRQLQALLGNAHVAIWVAAFLFSCFHVQFYGLVPRLLLGALFGYLYLFSGSLWMPIFAHFVNNGLVVFFLYLEQRGQDLGSVATDAPPPSGGMSGVALLLVGVGLYAFYRWENGK